MTIHSPERRSILHHYKYTIIYIYDWKKFCNHIIMRTIILVSVGILQKYILVNIEQLLLLGYTNIYVIVNQRYFSKFSKYTTITLIDANSLDTTYFNKNSKLNTAFRRGFWSNCTKRFFLIYELMRNRGLKNVIHLENDVLLYTKMDYKLDEKIYLTMDSPNRCIPGIIYIPNSDLMKNLIDNFNLVKNDMENLADFYNKNKTLVKTFPIMDPSIKKCVYNENFSEFKSIFDGAAIGQYLGGVDPRNIQGDSTGFINETCVIKYNQYKFKWVQQGKHSFPHIEINGQLIPINNLHIHSKKLRKFAL